MRKIVFLDAITVNPGDLSWEPFRELGELVVYDRTREEEVVSRCKDAEVVIVNKTSLDESHFNRLPRLRLVCVAATGYDRVDVEAASHRGIVVANCVGYSSWPVAQLVASFVLQVADGVSDYVLCNRQGKWSSSLDFCYTLRDRIELRGKDFTIVGFGHIGQSVAEVMRPWGVRLQAVTSKRPDELPDDVKKVSLEEAFSSSHFVSLNCPLTEATRLMVNKELLAKANPEMVLINTARGGLVDEGALANALGRGQLRAYCADVLSQEPPVADNPLFKAPNCLLTPHIGWDTPESRQRILDMLVSNIQAFFNGRPIHLVNECVSLEKTKDFTISK